MGVRSQHLTNITCSLNLKIKRGIEELIIDFREKNRGVDEGCSICGLRCKTVSHVYSVRNRKVKIPKKIIVFKLDDLTWKKRHHRLEALLIDLLGNSSPNDAFSP